MKRWISITIPSVALLCAAMIWMVQSGHEINKDEATNTRKLSKLERIEGMFKHEFNKTKDPALGVVPKQRLFKAKNYIDEFLTSKSNPFEIDWEERGPNMVGGRTRGMIFDLNDPTGGTVWAGGVGGGLWKNTNIRSETSEWIKVSDDFANIAITSIVQDPTNPDVMFFGTGEPFAGANAIRGLGIWRSMDGGDTWSPSEGAEDLNFEYVFEMLSDPQGNIYVATRKGLYVTDDDGLTWRYLLGENRSAESNDVVDVEIASDGTIFATVGMSDGDGIYRQLPGQSSFAKLDFNINQSDYRRIEMAVAPTDPNRLYALLAGSGGVCRYIIRSDNGGASWRELEVPRAVGMNNFARNQAWYDLEVEVDPNNADRVFIGGIDILLSENGGEDWDQISQWFGRNFQYVHADQHRVVFSPIDPKEAIFGNDGGVFYSADITVSEPVIESRIFGYNVTQYYAAAMHPVDDNLFIGGTQDNGSHIFESAGMNPGRRLTGGDGAFCHIDQDNPNVMITSYVYNSYYFSNNGGNDFISARYGNDIGLFINPTEYDSETNTLFTNFTGGVYLKVNNVHLLNTQEDIVPVSEFNGGSIQSLKASPNVRDRIYFGLTNGRVVYVDEASQDLDSALATVISTELVDRGFISSIDVAEGNEDHVILTYSNYGVESVWETRDGGENWVNIEGNLPDMPVRWAIFAPDNEELILLATEMGVWSSAEINGADTEWTPSNLSFANTRVDMLNKNNNGTVLAATHGRGIFTTNSFKELSVSLLDSFSVHFNSRYRVAGCEENYDTVRIPLVVSKVPDSDIEVVIEGVDQWPSSAQILSDVIRFSPSEGETKKFIEILVAQDDYLGENFKIGFDLASSADYAFGNISSFTLEVVDDLNDDVSFLMYREDDLPSKIELISEKSFGNRFQIVYSIDELKQAGIGAGQIEGIQLYTTTSDQSGAGVEMEMYIGRASFDNAPFGFPYQNGLGDPVFEGTYTFEKGSNTIFFDEPYLWDGDTHLALQFCFSNAENVGTIELISNRMDRNTVINRVSEDSRINPCSFFTATDYHEIQPIVGFIGIPRIADSSGLETVLDYLDEVTVVLNENYELLAAVEGSADEETCLEIAIEEYDPAVEYPVIESPSSLREFYLKTDGSTNHEMELMFKSDDFDPAVLVDSLEMIVCNTPFESAELENCQIVTHGKDWVNTGVDSFLVVSAVMPAEETQYVTLARGFVTNSREEVAEDKISIYPIPFDNTLFVSSESRTSLEIIDISGRIILNDPNERTNRTINTETMVSGVYWVVLKSEEGTVLRKIVK